MKKLFRGIWISVLMALGAMVSGNVMAKGGFVDLYPGDFEFDGEPYDLDNPWRPQNPGDRFVYFEENECELGIVDVEPAATKIIRGILVRTVLDRAYFSSDEDCVVPGNLSNPESEGWILLEITHDWYAQDEDKNAWYFGEHSVALDVDENDCEHWTENDDTWGLEGCLDGSWQAGFDIWAEVVNLEIREGVVMLADPMKGQFYFQEFWADEATDMGKVLSFKPVDDTIYGDMEHCVVIKEWVPLSPGNVEHKYYCEGYGLVLVEGNAGGPTVNEVLVDGPDRD